MLFKTAPSVFEIIFLASLLIFRSIGNSSSFSMLTLFDFRWCMVNSFPGELYAANYANGQPRTIGHVKFPG